MEAYERRMAAGIRREEAKTRSAAKGAIAERAASLGRCDARIGKPANYDVALEYTPAKRLVFHDAYWAAYNAGR